MRVGFILLGAIVLVGAASLGDKEGLQGFHHLKDLKPLGTEFADYFQNVTLNDLSLTPDYQLRRIFCALVICPSL